MTKIKTEQKIAINALRRAGIGYGKIAKQLELEKSTVAKFCQNQALIDAIGPKVKFSRAAIKGRNLLRIKRFIECNPLATLEDIKLALDLEVSTKTISLHLKKAGLPTRVAKRKIVISEVNKKKRMDFCRSMLEKDDEYLASIWFSDETIVKGRPNGEVVLFRSVKGSEWYEPSNGSGGKSVMFWGCVSKNAYGPLVEVIGKNTADTYIDTLQDYLLPEIEAANGRVIFQQDNASIHKTQAVTTFLEENRIETLKWPPQSPDLSPIENLWNCMKMKMKARQPRPRSHASMRDACLEIWQGFDDSLRIKLINSFRERCRLCLEAKGELIKYVANYWGGKKR